MTMAVDISPQEREQIRLRFFREHRAMGGFASVAVRRDRRTGGWFLDVAVDGELMLDETFMGFAVRVKRAPMAVNAVGPVDHIR